MKKHTGQIIGILLILIAALTGCAGSGGQSGGQGYSLYYLNKDEDTLVSVECDLEQTDPQEAVSELWLLEQKKPESEKYTSLLPEQVAVEDFTLSENLLILDMSYSYNEMSKDREILVREGLVRLFTQIDTIKKVQFTVDGESLKNSDGTEVGALSEGSFVSNAGMSVNSYQKTSMILYFADESGTQLMPEERNVYYNSNIPLGKAVVEQLIRGPKESGHFATLPAGISILNVTLQDGICYVNFDNTFTALLNAAGDSFNSDLAVYSIVNSLTDVCGAEKVQISVDGDTDCIIGSVHLNQLLTADYTLVAPADTNLETEE